MGGAAEDRISDLRIAKPTFILAVTFNQTLRKPIRRVCDWNGLVQ